MTTTVRLKYLSFPEIYFWPKIDWLLLYSSNISIFYIFCGVKDSTQ